jgi:hypothetical protein
MKRVLEGVLRDDRCVSSHLHVGWVAFYLGLLGEIGFSFFLLSFV